MRKRNTREIASAHKCMLMAAIAYNIKKYMKFNPRGCKVMAATKETAIKHLKTADFNIYLTVFEPATLFSRKPPFYAS